MLLQYMYFSTFDAGTLVCLHLLYMPQEKNAAFSKTRVQ